MYLYIVKSDSKTHRVHKTIPIAHRFVHTRAVCHDAFVGCFSNEHPFNNVGRVLPASPAIIRTEFRLYTSARHSPDTLSYENDSSIRVSRFDRRMPLKIVIHGFGTNTSAPWLHRMTSKLLRV